MQSSLAVRENCEPGLRALRASPSQICASRISGESIKSQARRYMAGMKREQGNRTLESPKVGPPRRAK